MGVASKDARGKGGKGGADEGARTGTCDCVAVRECEDVTLSTESSAALCCTGANADARVLSRTT